MLSATRSVAHADASANQGESATAWTGEKRRKTIRPPPLSSSEDAEGAMDIQFQEVQGVTREVEQDRQDEDTGSVFSAADKISLEETNRLCEKLKSRESTCRQGRLQAIMTPEERDEMLRYIRRLRLGDNRRDGTDTSSENVDMDWEDVDPSLTYDWTIYPLHGHCLDLDIYQRIIPTREFFDEYLDWADYCNTLSNYETDEEYVKYWDEMVKKLKWIEEYVHLEGMEAALQRSDFRETACRQALKIAAGFSHLPLSLADRGYNEYFEDTRRISASKIIDHAYFELWKRVRGQKMSFKEALEELQSNSMFHSRLKVRIQEPWFHEWEHKFKTFMKLNPESVSEDVILEQFTSMLDSKYQRKSSKPYVEFVKKKLEVARRLGLPDGPDDRNGDPQSGSATMTSSEG
jgi:hypothetical protein